MIFVANQLPNSACLIRDLISDVLSKAVKNKVGSPRLKTILVSRPLDIIPERSTALWELKEHEREHSTKDCYLPTTLVNLVTENSCAKANFYQHLTFLAPLPDAQSLAIPAEQTEDACRRVHHQL